MPSPARSAWSVLGSVPGAIVRAPRLEQRDPSGRLIPSQVVALRVRIVQLGKGIFTYEASAGATLAEGLAAAGIAAEHRDVRINGRPAASEYPLADGDLVTVVPMIKGGQEKNRHP
jgi:sulfur carrier protein ThiS